MKLLGTSVAVIVLKSLRVAPLAMVMLQLDGTLVTLPTAGNGVIGAFPSVTITPLIVQPPPTVSVLGDSR